ncbi:MAG: NAD(P)/FAD-dependent oxidoreductase [Defluviitaleaceae bacterium]|nr:NAD(P)/FAD-dependent oxidoreductase [Defluviitaleaceae bacterium]
MTIIIGAGTAGLMAAAHQKGKVILLEKGDKLGRKLELSGGGRCNITNRKPVDEFIKNIVGNGRFLHSAFSKFNNEHIIDFFENLGIKLKEENDGRMFPVSNKASDIVNILLKVIEQNNVIIKKNCIAKKIVFENDKVSGILLANGEFLYAKKIIVATGGKSFPKTGSTGDGYAWAQEAGHTITELFPTEVPIKSSEKFVLDKTLMGLSLKDVNLKVMDGKKVVANHSGDVIFTHFGISGPAALRCSQFVLKTMKKRKIDKITMTLDVCPTFNQDELTNKIESILEKTNKKPQNSLKQLAPERFLEFIMEEGENSGKIAEKLKKFTFTVNGTLPIEKSFVTGGGVSVKEINPATMESKLIKGLYFCGEILDIHGYTGGYNITVALVTGRIAASVA